MSAIVSSTLGDQGAADRATAYEARLAVPLIDAMGLLKTSQATVGIHVIGDG